MVPFIGLSRKLKKYLILTQVKLLVGNRTGLGPEAWIGTGSLHREYLRATFSIPDATPSL